jgi:hypothetical protein
MNDLEQAILCRCIRRLKEAGDYKTYEELAAKMVADLTAKRTGSDKDKLFKATVNFLERNIPNKEYTTAVGEAALKFVYVNRERIFSLYRSDDENTEDPSATTTYIAHILRKYNQLPPRERHASLPVDAIFENWKKTSLKAEVATTALRSGLYQIYRRHKPFQSTKTHFVQEGEPLSSPEESENADDCVVTELVYVDAQSKECLLVASTRQLYSGSLHINARHTAFFLFQSERELGSFDHRFFCLQLEGRLPFYSAVSVRTGDKSFRPITSECLVVDIFDNDHPELYEALKTLRKPGAYSGPIENRVILDYIASTPPRGTRTSGNSTWRWVKYLRDFPFLSQLVLQSRAGLPEFQEPIRSMNVERVMALDENKMMPPLGVFQHSKLKDAHGASG